MWTQTSVLDQYSNFEKLANNKLQGAQNHLLSQKWRQMDKGEITWAEKGRHDLRITRRELRFGLPSALFSRSKGYATLAKMKKIKKMKKHNAICGSSKDISAAVPLFRKQE